MKEKVKNLEYYLHLPYNIVIKPYEDGAYFARIEELPGCITEGDTIEETLELIEDAKRVWIEGALEDGIEIPEPAPETYSGRVLIRMPRSLHRRLAERAKREGVSLNQFVNYALAKEVKEG
jgi:antitoxin HicB